jgi:hypothetical protein
MVHVLVGVIHEFLRMAEVVSLFVRFSRLALVFLTIVLAFVFNVTA